MTEDVRGNPYPAEPRSPRLVGAFVDPPSYPVKNPEEMPRQQLLAEAMKITSVDRNKTYGSPEDNFRNIVDFWNIYLHQRFGEAAQMLNTMDVAYLMVLMKMARLSTNQTHHDSLVDVAGYAACAADCQEAHKKNPSN